MSRAEDRKNAAGVIHYSFLRPGETITAEKYCQYINEMNDNLARGMPYLQPPLLTLSFFIRSPRDFSVDLLRQSNGNLTGLLIILESFKLAGEGRNRDLLIPLFQDDSGIDSDDAERARAQLNLRGLIQLTESSSSDEEPMLKEPWIRTTKRRFDEQLRNMEEGRLEREVLIPLKPWRSYCDDASLPSTPDRSSPPLYEVELTASDEDDDASVLELVIPVQTRYRIGTPQNAIAASIFCSLLCCLLAPARHVWQAELAEWRGAAPEPVSRASAPGEVTRVLVHPATYITIRTHSPQPPTPTSTHAIYSANYIQPNSNGTRDTRCISEIEVAGCVWGRRARVRPLQALGRTAGMLATQRSQSCNEEGAFFGARALRRPRGKGSGSPPC
ncbi:unnamed protein product [Danaus chrysippus]|uniref:(African queen) hypothetical protein n=1 Tax=Danaus chrysippus TaxID=151541 RepID=A0A8J2QRU9_9NEOP|nr:unnamed protein product [Danaus chrysippus]